jgi:peroxiredoxin
MSCIFLIEFQKFRFASCTTLSCSFSQNTFNLRGVFPEIDDLRLLSVSSIILFSRARQCRAPTIARAGTVSCPYKDADFVHFPNKNVKGRQTRDAHARSLCSALGSKKEMTSVVSLYPFSFKSSVSSSIPGFRLPSPPEPPQSK